MHEKLTGCQLDGPACLLGILPCVPLIPYIPQKDEGILIDPPQSDHCATGVTPDATEAPVPPLDPPAV